MRSALPIGFALGAAVWTAAAGFPAAAYPVTVKSCNDMVTFAKAPTRAITGTANMIQTVLDMGLTDRFIGFSNLNDKTLAQLKAPPAVLKDIERKRSSQGKVSLETIIGQGPDFYFSGWLYGFDQAKGITPADLRKYDIGTYVLNESCVKAGVHVPVSMQMSYTDITALGQIFGVEGRAAALVEQQKRQVAFVAAKLAKVKRRYRVWYCSGCTSDAAPRTTGAEGFPKILIDAAGGKHIFDDIKDSYVNVSWETVIQRDPEWMILDPNFRPPEETIRYLTNAPALRNVSAVKNRRFIFITLPEFEPSTRNAEGIERIARTMYPEAFK